MTVLADLIRFTTATTGTGTLTVGGAVAPFMTPATYGAPFASGTAVVFYSIIDTQGGNSETGTGTYTASGTTLTRTPITSTNSNSAINLSGTAQATTAEVTQYYQNVLGRAPDAPGLAFWSRFSAAQALAGVCQSAEAGGLRATRFASGLWFS